MLVKAFGILLLIQLYCCHYANSTDIECLDMKKVNTLGNLLYRLSSKKQADFEVYFNVATRKHRDHVRIDLNNITTLEDSSFDPSLKTIILIHGYQSTGENDWVIELKEKLLDAVNANVIMVDWSKGGCASIYVNSARQTLTAANKILNFLEGLRPRVKLLNGSSNDVMWNQVYFIGHSLGAHVCGQTANLLKRDSNWDTFWTVERITGLDPAKPCFTDITDPAVRLDKEDAEFVDVIHTQVGTDDSNGLGLGEKIGHVDFYVNSGIIQPECNKTRFMDMFIKKDLTKLVCSHRLAYVYFTNAIAEKISGGCSFPSYYWDGSYDDADRILKQRTIGSYCYDCPEMGLDAKNTTRTGMFMVITSDSEPYCRLKSDLSIFDRLANIFEKLRGAKSIFSREK